MTTNNRKISLIAALQKKDRGIGLENKLIFKISEDLKRFKQLTSGHPIIMGRKTFESIGSKPLPNRTNIVVTRQDLAQEGIVFCHSLEEAIKIAENIDENIFIIGGAEIYTQALPFATHLELTLLDGHHLADTFFPPYEEFSKVIFHEKHTDEKTGLEYEWVTLIKNIKAGPSFGPACLSLHEPR
jgi:dihydrofolate reductase